MKFNLSILLFLVTINSYGQYEYEDLCREFFEKCKYYEDYKEYSFYLSQDDQNRMLRYWHESILPEWEDELISTLKIKSIIVGNDRCEEVQKYSFDAKGEIISISGVQNDILRYSKDSFQPELNSKKHSLIFNPITAEEYSKAQPYDIFYSLHCDEIYEFNESDSIFFRFQIDSMGKPIFVEFDYISPSEINKNNYSDYLTYQLYEYNFNKRDSVKTTIGYGPGTDEFSFHNDPFFSISIKNRMDYFKILHKEINYFVDGDYCSLGNIYKCENIDGIEGVDTCYMVYSDNYGPSNKIKHSRFPVIHESFKYEKNKIIIKKYFFKGSNRWSSDLFHVSDDYLFDEERHLNYDSSGFLLSESVFSRKPFFCDIIDDNAWEKSKCRDTVHEETYTFQLKEINRINGNIVNIIYEFSDSLNINDYELFKKDSLIGKTKRNENITETPVKKLSKREFKKQLKEFQEEILKPEYAVEYFTEE